MANQNKRTVYRANMDEIFKFAALVNSGGINKPYTQTAIQLLKRCVVAQKGAEKREITDDEVTQLIAKGYKLTG